MVIRYRYLKSFKSGTFHQQPLKHIQRHPESFGDTLCILSMLTNT